MKFKACPKCGSKDLGDRWVSGRKLQQYCSNNDMWDRGGWDENEGCGWKGEPRIPEKQKVSVERPVSVGCWCYHLFDKYGHTMTYSQGFGSKKETETVLLKELEKGKTNTEYGPYSGVIWPPTTIVRGTYYE